MLKLRRQSIVLIALVIVFAAPGLFAYIFFNHPTWLEATPTNRGLLLNSPRALTTMDHSKKWRLVFWSPNACDASCVQAMDKLGRIRLALGRRLYHVDAYLVLDANTSTLSKSELKLLHDHDNHVLILPAHDEADRAILGNQSAFYIVSPENDVILSYSLSSQSDDIYHDIKQLVMDK